MSENDAMLDEGMLLEAARDARKKAYAPYSRFLVGAAILDDQGKLHKGCNVENAAYPQGTCAEAGAIAAMILAEGRQIKALAVVGESTNPVTPCGGCRQKIREFAKPTTPILIGDLKVLRLRQTLAELLPHSFGPEYLLNEPQ
ncbi:MAG TPA: cytidine deaminase [Deltaproteobacteria bacterium]|nr:MAG: cytidine deaminase [Pseudomonadota bacterium]HBM54373.1 cytidine deaminase [Deltaproteobacteria bacterium]